MKILLFRAQLVDILNNLKEKPDVATLLLVIPLVIFWNHVFFFKHAGEPRMKETIVKPGMIGRFFPLLHLPSL